MLKFFNSFYNKVTGDLASILENDDSESLSQVIKNKETANQTYLDNAASLFYRACSRNAFKCLIWLLKIKADPDLVNISPLPWTPLRFAIENNLTSLTYLLIMHGANSDKSEPGFEFATPRNTANPEMKEVINQAMQLYQSFRCLKEEYETLKTRADAAYKKPNMEEARKLYQVAAEKYENMSEIWQQLYLQERNEVLKSYYCEQRDLYLEVAIKLKSAITSSEIYSEQRFYIDKNDISSQIRQRKIFQKKTQPIKEKQPSEHKLVM